MNKKLVIVLMLGVFAFFSNLGGTSIYILDEAKNAGCAAEMLRNGDWVVPTFNGVLRTDKPPLHYYAMMLSYSLFGVSPFAARFFSAIAALALLLVVYVNVARLINARTAFFTCLVLLSSIQLVVQFHLAVPDPYLILLMTIALFYYYRGIHENSSLLYIAYAATALAFLTKGPVAVVLPGIIVLAYLILTKRLQRSFIRDLKLGRGILIFCFLAMPWYVAVGLATDGEWLKGFFLDHNVNRFSSTMEGHRGFPLVPFLILIVALLPFSVFIVQAVKLAVAKRKQENLLLFNMVVVATFGLFFSFSKTLLPSYLAPAIPFLAVILGYYLHHFVTKFSGLTFKIRTSLVFNLAISLAIPFAIAAALRKETALSTQVWVSYLFSVLPIGSLLGCYFLWRNMPAMFVYSWAGTWMVTSILFFQIALPIVDSGNPVLESKELIQKKYTDRMEVGYKLFNPAFVFDQQRNIKVIHSPAQLDSLAALSNKHIILTRAKYLEDFKSDSVWRVVYRKRDLFETSETVLLVN
jgi:4-amino-4-deoxy-L-arabinose transferase-like glycosyltransferase